MPLFETPMKAQIFVDNELSLIIIDNYKWFKLHSIDEGSSK